MAKARRQGTTLVAYAIVALACGGALSMLEPIAVTGGSMSPALRHGDLALVRRHAVPREGDIALLRLEGHSAALHRVVWVRRDGSFVTKGDANPIEDQAPATAEDVAGVVVAYLPFGTALEWWRGGLSRDTLSVQSNTAKR